MFLSTSSSFSGLLFILFFFSSSKFCPQSNAYWGERKKIAEAEWRVGRSDRDGEGEVKRQKKMKHKWKKDVYNLRSEAKFMRHSAHIPTCTHEHTSLIIETRSHVVYRWVFLSLFTLHLMEQLFGLLADDLLAPVPWSFWAGIVLTWCRPWAVVGQLLTWCVQQSGQ